MKRKVIDSDDEESPKMKKETRRLEKFNDEEFFFINSPKSKKERQTKKDKIEEEEEEKESEELSLDYNDAAIKSYQSSTNENEEEIFYKYSWRRLNVAYYKCLSANCGCRGKTVIETDHTNKAFKLSSFSVNIYYFIYIKYTYVR